MKFRRLISGLTSLALSFSVFAGVGTQKALNSVEANAASANWKFDFGNGGVTSGYTGVSSGDGYDASRGYGFAQTWNVGNVSAGGSGAGSDAVEFKSDDGANTFNVDLPKGLYEVKVTVGNAPRCSIKMEGMLQIMNLTRLNATETVKLPVTDGQLNIQAVTGIKNGQRSISAVEIKQINTTGEMPKMVWICGDSTVANYYNQADTAQHGWGQFFGGYVEGYEVRNMATSGQYAKGFVDGGQFEPIETYGKSGDKYIISIGINDTNYSNGDEYYATVTDMVKKAKAKGMEVILVKQQGRHGDYNRSPKLSGRWFGGQLDTIGSEQNVQVVDLFTMWQDFGFSIGGYDAMTPYYAADDDLHQSLKGSQKLAELMADALKMTKEPSEMNTTKAYRFKNVNSGLYLEVKNAEAAAGANVQQWSGDTVGEWNVWHLAHKGYNYYEIWSYLDGGDKYLLDVDGGKGDNGTNIGIYTNTNSGAQWFRFFENGDGSYTIVSRCSGDKGALEVGSASTAAGGNVQQWELNGHNCQKWILEEVDWGADDYTQPEDGSSDPIAFGDINGDGRVNVFDMMFLRRKFVENDAAKYDSVSDLNADGQVNIADLVQLRSFLLKGTQCTAAAEGLGFVYAADQEFTKGIEETLNAGFRYRSYVNLDNEIGVRMVWTVNVPADGNYLCNFGIANGADENRKMKIEVKGQKDYWVQDFLTTGAWMNWDERGLVLPLRKGINHIRMTSMVSGGGPNFDYLRMTKTDEPIAEPYDPTKEDSKQTGGDHTLFIAGDSTVQTYNERARTQNGGPIQGWGAFIGDYLSDGITVSNHALAGRSSKSFYDQGRWKTIADSLQKGDFVMIQFAINDSAKSNAERYAPVCGNVNSPASGSYEWYMTQFINDTLAKGATPILVTTTLSAKSYSNGKFVGSYGDYCNACKSLASKYSIPCIDLNTLMVNHYNSVGYDKACSYHMAAVVQGSTDYTHFNDDGAKVIAGIVANAVKSQGISGLSGYVK